MWCHFILVVASVKQSILACKLDFKESILSPLVLTFLLYTLVNYSSCWSLDKFNQVMLSESSECSKNENAAFNFLSNPFINLMTFTCKSHHCYSL